MKKLFFTLPLLCILNCLFAQSPRNYDLKKKEFFSVAFSRDGNLMSAGDLEGDLVVWDVEKQTIIHDLTGQYGNVISTVFSPDGYYVAAGATDGTIHVYMITNGLLDKKFTGHTDAVTSMVFSPDGRFLYSASADHTIAKWDIERNFKVSELRGHTGAISGLSISLDGETLVSSSYDGTIKVWSAEMNTEKASIDLKCGEVRDVSFGPHARYIVAGCKDKSLRIIDMESYTIGLILRGHDDIVYKVKFSADGQYIISGSLDHTARIWDAETGSMVKTYKLKDNCFDLDINNKGNWLALIQGSQTVQLHDLNSYEIAPAKLRPLSKLLYAQEGNADYTKPKKTIVTFNKTKPELAIVQPKQDPTKEYILHFDKEITLKGSVNSENGLFELVINNTDVPVINDKFSHKVKLAFGNNTIKIKAVDIYNNVKTQTLVVQRQIKLENVNDQVVRQAKDYALIIATDEYVHWDNLSNPINDASTIKGILEKDYGFQTEIIKNPSRSELYGMLRKYSKMQFSDQDQLFIFIAGHGEFDDIFTEGYVVTKDSKLDDDVKESYISHSNLRTIINNIPCNHILLTMDVCFGGTFDPHIAGGSRGGLNTHSLTASERDKFIERKLKSKTRMYMTSGGKEYVPDGRPGHHSPFASKLIGALKSHGGTDGLLTFNELFSSVETTFPHPMSGTFGKNQPGSDFIFIQKDWKSK